MAVTKKDLLGAWHLQSWVISYADKEALSYPFGEHPTGLIVYTDDDWMSAAINRDARAALPTDQSFRAIDSDRLADAYRSYFHYAGRFSVADGVVIHSVTQSLNPNFVGTQQRRDATLNGHTLVLAGVDDAGGVERSHTLTWHR